MNLLQETINKLAEHGKSVSDVKWVGDENIHTTWENFANIANVNYYNGFGGQEVAVDLLIVGDNWWMERHEYDGSEWWEFKQLPTKPQKPMTLNTVIGGSWNSLEEINSEEDEN